MNLSHDEAVEAAIVALQGAHVTEWPEKDSWGFDYWQLTYGSEKAFIIRKCIHTLKKYSPELALEVMYLRIEEDRLNQKIDRLEKALEESGIEENK